jgi:hypothetical protein
VQEDASPDKVLAQLAAPVTYHEPRAKKMRAVRRKLVSVSSLHNQVAALVVEQNTAIDALEYTVSRAEERIDAVHTQLSDAAPRIYRTWGRRVRNKLVPQSLPAKLRCCLAALIVGNIGLVYFGFL